MRKLNRRDIFTGSLAATAVLICPEFLLGQEKKGVHDHASKPGDGKMPHDAVHQQHVSEMMAELKEGFAQSRDYSIAVVEAMPDEKLNFRPVADVRSFGEQMVHIAESSPGMFERFIEGTKTPKYQFSEAMKEKVGTKAQIIQQIRTGFDEMERDLSNLTGMDLHAKAKFFGGKEASKMSIIRAILDHATHHRAQAITYLRLSGIKPPSYRVL